MHASARVLLYSDTKDAGGLAGRLAQHGFEPLPANSRDDALRIVTGRYPDIAIVDAAKDVESARFRQDLLDLRPDGGIPTIVIGAADETSEDSLQIEFLPAVFRDAELFSRLETLARLVTMQGELALRSETSEIFGLEVPTHVVPAAEVANSRILVIASDEAMQRTVIDMIAPIATAEGVSQPYEAIERLLQDPFDAVVAVPADDAEGLLDFCRNLRNHTNLFNMPLLVLSSGDDTAADDQAYAAGVSDVLNLDKGASRLLSRLDHLVRQQRYRQAMQEVYREGRHNSATDALTGLFSHGYLHTHLQKQITECESREKDLAIGFFDISDMTGINGEYGYAAGDQLLRQIGGAIGSLVRAEDLPARFGGDKFCIVLPDSTQESAHPVLNRIAGVINLTEFAIGNDSEPVKVHLQTGCAAVQANDSAERLIARARANIYHR
ncbi:MAG: diguanylate cyclase [Alphaproteobacteria bacterium]|nr:diguanylate cyclase [Alphaproteobacteria bacterium]